MEHICRLCCSTDFVNNYIFDDESALYAKMTLYLPVKVMREDNLPQRVCDRCSCKVNDLYQFCNEVIEAQKKLRAGQPVLYDVKAESIDLTIVKSSESPCPAKPPEFCEQGTQTELLQEPVPVKDIKEEPKVKPEKNGSLSAMGDYPGDCASDNSDDVSLKDVKQRKKLSQVKAAMSNGVPHTPKVRRKKRKSLEFTDPDKDLDVVKTEPEVLLEVKSEQSELVSFTCCMCFMQCCSRSDLLHHYRLHESATEYPPVPAPPPPPTTDPIRCGRCQKTLEPSQWESHWTRHWQRDLRPFKCSLCEKTFRNPQQILKHGLNHKPGNLETNTDLDKRFGCDFCPEVFVYMRSLLSHRVSAHPTVSSRPVSLRCVQCGRGFAHLNSLRRHQRAHSGSRDFLCSVCGKALSSQEHLKFHLRIHTGYKPNVCKTCGKGFVKKCNLTLHERVHSGEKPHVCSHCGKAFSQRSTLVIHERYHSGARPYVCGLCGRGFVAKGLLSMHLKTTCI